MVQAPKTSEREQHADRIVDEDDLAWLAAFVDEFSEELAFLRDR